jgi:hypothetical protein
LVIRICTVGHPPPEDTRYACMLTVAEFFKARKRYTNEFFEADPPSDKTVLVSSYIWWTDLIAHAVLKLGCNVLVAEPWYVFFLRDDRFANFEVAYDAWVQQIKRFKVQLVIGGNTTCMVPHIKTKQLLHNAAGVPLVNYWWDEPRVMALMTRRGFTAADYLNALRDDRTLNVFWDIDVEQEMNRFFNLTNTAHVPVGTTPDFWAPTRNLPLKDRPVDLCFIGNNHDEGGWLESADPVVIRWADRAAA